MYINNNLVNEKKLALLLKDLREATEFQQPPKMQIDNKNDQAENIQDISRHPIVWTGNLWIHSNR